MKPVFLDRLLVVAPPRQGKTTTLVQIIKTYRTGGLVFDPLGELAELTGAPSRWKFIHDHRLITTPPDRLKKIQDDLDSLEPGSAVVGDEFGRWLPSKLDDNPLLWFLDTARNRGVRFVLAEKKPTRLHSLVTDLVDVMALRPWRSAAQRRWLGDADLPAELPDPGDFHFYICGTAGEVGKIELWKLAKAFGTETAGSDFLLDPAPPKT